MVIGRRLGGSVSWGVDAKFVRGRKPMFTWKDHVARLVVSLLQFVIYVAMLVLVRGKSAMLSVRKGKLQ
jgi:hypothetical protein